MTVLSITFHTIASSLESWDSYLHGELHQMIENLYDVEKYIISTVESERISEGQNTNLLLVFESKEIRASFMENELVNLVEHVEKRFNEEVMVFVTALNPSKSRL